MIIIHGNYSDMEAELDRVGSMPTPKMRGLLDAVLKFSFEGTRSIVHIRTGKLEESGNEETSVKEGIWTGQFSFPAPNKKGTPYGIYEIARGGAHNFTRNWNTIKPLLKSALVKGLHRR